VERTEKGRIKESATRERIAGVARGDHIKRKVDRRVVWV